MRGLQANTRRLGELRVFFTLLSGVPFPAFLT